MKAIYMNRLRDIIKKRRVYKKAGILLLLTIVCFICVFISDNSIKVEKDEEGRSILKRNRQGEGKSTEELEAKIGDRTENFEITVSEKTYSGEEIDQVFQIAAEDLERLILGENDSLESVRHKLDLITEIPGKGISVSWELDNYDVMDIQGKIKEEKVTEEGTELKLTANLSYEEERAAYEFYVKIYPPEMDSRERLLKNLNLEIEQYDEETRTEDYLILPDEIDGREIEWRYGPRTRAFGILLLGIGASVMMIYSGKREGKERKKQRERQMSIDYPQIINKFNMYISSGMTIRKAWFCIAQDYEKDRERTGKRYAYEEMMYTVHQIQGGGAEGECYEEYGIRCRLSPYKKFGTLLSQNLRKGSRGLTELLRREAEEAFEERKNLAKKLGEEAGTKMMIPMFMMLAIVFIIVTVPAFFTIQI